MKLYGKYCFYDLLEGSPLNFDGLTIDTHVEVTVTRIDQHSFEIDSSDFGEKDIYVLTKFGHQVKVDRAGNAKLFRELEAAIDARALALAAELPDDVWSDLNAENI